MLGIKLNFERSIFFYQDITSRMQSSGIFSSLKRLFWWLSTGHLIHLSFEDLKVQIEQMEGGAEAICEFCHVLLDDGQAVLTVRSDLLEVTI